MQWSYLIGLTIAIACLTVIDYRKKLAFFYDARRTRMTVGLMMAIFILWDLIGINLGIFFSGHSQFALSFMILPDFPIEELFFLFLFCYITLLIYRFVRSSWKHIS